MGNWNARREYANHAPRPFPSANGNERARVYEHRATPRQRGTAPRDSRARGVTDKEPPDHRSDERIIMETSTVARVRIVTARKPTRAKGLGVSDEQYARLLAAQGGHCALCPNGPKTRRLHVDHEHSTGKVRGLLCHRCNRVLPTWVAASWLRGAASYIYGHGLRFVPEARAVLDEINGIGKDEAL